MKKEVFDLVKKESLYFGILLTVLLIIFKISFYNDSFVVLARSVLSIFWLFIIPGYFGMLFWHEKLDFVQRIIIGTALAAGLIGTISYYLGLIGLNIKYHMLLLPLLIITLGFSLSMMKKKG